MSQNGHFSVRDYSVVETIVLTNDSAKACSISGYPKIAFLFLNGAAENAAVRFTSRDVNFTSPEPTTIAMQPSQSVSFFLGYPKADAHGYACDAISSIAIRGFAHGGTVSLPDTISPCSTVNVSPFFRS
jgi:hypothetical protein